MPSVLTIPWVGRAGVDRAGWDEPPPPRLLPSKVAEENVEKQDTCSFEVGLST